MSKNALQAVLDRAALQSEPVTPSGPAPKPAGKRVSAAPVRKAVKTVPAAPMADAEAEGEGERFYRPSRDGKRFIGGHFDPAVGKQLRIIAAEDDTTVQALLEEALDLLFLKKGRQKIASLSK